MKLDKYIKELCRTSNVSISPIKYNDLYTKLNNLNKLLAWGHEGSDKSPVCLCSRVLQHRVALLMKTDPPTYQGNLQFLCYMQILKDNLL